MANLDSVFNARYAFPNKRPGETFCTCGSMLHSITAEVKNKQSNEPTVDSPCMSVEFKKSALKNTEKVNVMETLQNHKTIKKSKSLFGLRKEAQL